MISGGKFYFDFSLDKLGILLSANCVYFCIGKRNCSCWLCSETVLKPWYFIRKFEHVDIGAIYSTRRISFKLPKLVIKFSEVALGHQLHIGLKNRPIVWRFKEGCIDNSGLLSLANQASVSFILFWMTACMIALR